MRSPEIPVPYSEQRRPPKWTRGLFGYQDYLVPIDQLEVNGDRFEFIHENQGVWSCETVIHEADPPVFSDSLNRGDSDKMKKVCDSLSHFLTTFCLQELVFGSRHVECVELALGDIRKLVGTKLSDLWIEGIYAFKKPTHSFYLCNRNLLVMKTQDLYWLATNDEKAVSIINAARDLDRQQSQAVPAKLSSQRSTPRRSNAQGIPVKTLLDDVEEVFIEQINCEEDLSVYVVEGLFGDPHTIEGPIQAENVQEIEPLGRRYVVRFPNYVCFQKVHSFFDSELDPNVDCGPIFQKIAKAKYRDFAKKLTASHPQMGAPDLYRLRTMNGVIEVAMFEEPMVETLN